MTIAASFNEETLNHSGLHEEMEQLVFMKMRLPACRFEVATLNKQG